MSHQRIYSFVIDPKSEFMIQAKMLVWSLVNLAKVPHQNIVANIVGTPDPASWEEIQSLGIATETISPYPDHPWCNKLNQLFKLKEYEFDDVVLLDCDMVVIEEPPIDDDAVQAKTVDTSNPPLETLSRLFELADLRIEITNSTATNEPTARGNANGGLYVIPKRFFHLLSEEWIRWASWCMGKKEIFGEKWIHIDQVSFALALSSSGIKFSELNQEYNFPTHLNLPQTADCRPKIIHYHRNTLGAQRILKTNNLPQANSTIDEVNARWARHLRENFSAASYWNSCYSSSSRTITESDKSTEQTKQESLLFATRLTAPARVLDIGGGDGRVISCINGQTNIVTLDIAIESKHLYLKEAPEATWILHDIRRPYFPQQKCDLICCMDLLTHLPTQADYAHTLDNLCAVGGNILISGYDSEPAEMSEIEFFHEPLTVSLEQRNRAWVPLTSYKGKTVFFSPNNDKNIHQRDISNQTLQASIPFIDNHPTLLESIYRSRDLIGFFPNHLPRCIEYPWIISNIAAGSRVIDAGAGVSVLPLLLANHGCQVTTIDSNTTIRDIKQKEGWNEWGFLDYSTIDSRIKSINTPYEKAEIDHEVDAIVSVSVVEHLPATIRHSWFNQAWQQLANEGLLLLTIDTVPHSFQLWNYSDGIQVEEEGSHGDLAMLQRELSEAGFIIEHMDHISWLPMSRVGMARIRARAIKTMA